MVLDRQTIDNVEHLATVAGQLMLAIQESILEEVPKTRPRPDSKRWWNGDLKKMWKAIYRLRSISYTYQAVADHPSHEELRIQSSLYREAIIQAKRQHWTSYLEEMTAADIWTANKFIKELAGDSGSPRIPMLKVKNKVGTIISINSNEDKARIFAKTFFPPPPPQPNIQEHFNYPELLPDPPQLTTEKLQRHVSKLSPYKAHGQTVSQT